MVQPFTLTSNILAQVAKISLLLGKYEGLHAQAPQPKLRRTNRIKTIQGSLAIEGNSLDLEQVTTVFENKRVLGPKKDILEVKNAIRLYELLPKLNPTSSKDLLKSHGILMQGLAFNAGKFRSGSVGIFKGSKVSHIAPPASRVPGLMEDLFLFLKKEKELSPLVQACIFHYELEFIHPFTDGNGRMGRFWQQLILTRHHATFEYISVESVIRERQQLYYEALEKSDKTGNSTLFIEFMLNCLRSSLEEFLDQVKPVPETPESRLSLAQEKFQNKEFTRKDYLYFFKSLSTATASRDLALGVSKLVLQKSGARALTRYRFSIFSILRMRRKITDS